MKLPGNVSESVRRLNKHLYGRQDNAGGQVSGAKPEQVVCNESVAKKVREAKNANRVHVRVVSFRRKLCDPDNLCPKYFIDCLRYSEIIKDDSARDMELTVTQTKVAKKELERTEITIEAL